LVKYYEGNQIIGDKMSRTCSTLRQMRNAYKILVGKSEETRDHFGDTDTKEGIILKLVLRIWDMCSGTFICRFVIKM
jgi:hypothetical protein